MATEYPKVAVCQALGVERSSLYYRSRPDAATEFKRAICDVCAEFPCYGYRRVTAELRRRAWRVNRKRVARWMAKLGLQARQVVRKRRTTNSQHPFPRYPNLVQGREAFQPDEVWVADITYIHLQRDFVYLAVLMDVCTRAIRGWHLGRSLEATLTREALLKALATQHCPQIHHSDQGVQYAATEYTELLQTQGIRISMAEVGQPAQNGYAERLMRTLKEEEVDLSDYENYAQAYQQIGRFLEDVYMRKRVHSSLNYLTPVEFQAQWHSLDSRHHFSVQFFGVTTVTAATCVLW
jgi:putative transposase